MPGAVFPVCSGIAGDFACDERELEAADSGGLAGAERSGDRGLLIFIHFHKSVFEPAAAHARQLDVGYQVKTAREIIAFDFAGLALARNADALEAAISEGGDRPTIGPVRNAAKIAGETHGLGGFAGNEHHFQGKARHARPSGLLADGNDYRTTLARVGCDCEEQRTSSGDDDAFSGYV